MEEERSKMRKFLTYANPVSPQTRLAAGVTAFPLLIFYGPSIQPTTFNAMLNGNNISGRFMPGPDQYELVWIPLKPGSNALTLAVEGVTTSGQRTRDTDKLVFLAE